MNAPAKPPTLPQSLAQNPRLARWLAFERDGSITVYSGKVEIGQGILTALAQIVAEELDVPLARVTMAQADTAHSPDEGVTSGSLSIMHSGSALRLACAEARRLLLECAAHRFGVAPESLRAIEGQVISQDGTQRARYGDLAAGGLLERDAQGTAIPKGPGEYRVVGASAARRDIPGKATGKPMFIQDLVLPGMSHARVLRPPGEGARLLAFDDARVRAMPGVSAVVRDGNFVGVVAEREDQVLRALEVLGRGCTWDAPSPLPPDPEIFLKQNVTRSAVLREKTDASAPSNAGARFKAHYTRPYVAHASLAPSCAMALWADPVRDSGQGAAVTVWSHTQGIFNLRADLAKALRVPEERVVVRHVEGAGCYGHNGADDVALDAALLARAIPGRPVKVQWTREDEFAWEPYGPAMVMELEAVLDSAESTSAPADSPLAPAKPHCIIDWRYEFWSNGHGTRPGRSDGCALLASWHLAEPLARAPTVNPPMPNGGAERNALPLYDFPNERVVNHYVAAVPLRVSALRSLGAYGNVFAIESFMDELALAAGADPVSFRLRHLSDPRARAVIEAAAAQAGWAAWNHEAGRAANRGQGIGFAKYKNLGAYCAVIAEVEVERELRVRRLVIAVDVGLVINPDGVRNQIEGGAIQATSWVLKEQVRYDAEHITSRAWADYPILRFSEVPVVEVVLIDRPELPATGAGEATQGPVAGAIANALWSALGVRVRDLPLTPERITLAMTAADTP